MWFTGLFTFGLAGFCLATPSDPLRPRNKRYNTKDEQGTEFTVFEHAATNTQLKFVTNSGICETTPGVNSYSGYLSVGADNHMWFWFFEARNSPTTAPLSLWLNGGPGCSSMVGLFQENGPCHFVDGQSEPSLNPYSWNTHANMLYVDQPTAIGSYGSNGSNGLNSTVGAAPYVWQFMQAFYDAFPQYENHDFGLFTESYGGHWGPEFASYFEDQNAAIKDGKLAGSEIKLVALGINNGLLDATIQYKAYLDYGLTNKYRQLLNQSQYNSQLREYYSQCLPAAASCTGTTGDDSSCTAADNICYNVTEGPIEDANDINYYDVRYTLEDPHSPPDTYGSYLQNASVMAAIGARVQYSMCSDTIVNDFVGTGDTFRSFLPALSKVVRSGITVLIWAGDADWLCNWIGNLECTNKIDYAGRTKFVSKVASPYTVNGTAAGEYKSVGNLNWLRVYEAGHEVPYYQPEVALQAFWQIMRNKTLSST
ncbi:putative carboxypeptidase S1 [Thozetella sp. PMI_491]|nr:putative carboxypeptidase S1 [Thozetella sp. PMI_491]